MVGSFEQRVARIVVGLSEEQLRVVAFSSLNELCGRYARKNDRLETELGLLYYQNECRRECLEEAGISDPFSQRNCDDKISVL